MPGAEQGWVWVVDCRAPMARTFDRIVRQAGFRSTIVQGVKAVFETGGRPGPEVALVHLNFTEGGGGLFVAWYLKHAYPGIRVVLYTWDCQGPSVSLVKHLRVGDALFTSDDLTRARITELLPVLAAAARADRAARETLGPMPAYEAGGPAHVINLPNLHAAIDETAIRLALEWQGSVRGAARILRIDPGTLRSKMKKLGIPEPQPDSDADDYGQ